jgi:hypothetical protein
MSNRSWRLQPASLGEHSRTPPRCRNHLQNLGFPARDDRLSREHLHETEDANASIRNARWLAAQIPDATLVLRQTAHVSSLHTHWPELLTTLRG